MSIIATAVKHLLAAGVTGDALVAAIAEMEAAQPKDAAAEKRRAYDRERKRRLNSTGIPPESAEIAETPTPSPSSSPDPSNNPTPAPVRETPRAKAGHRLPADWQPGPLAGEIGEAVTRWPPGAERRELDRFRDWAASATGPNAKKSDWQAAWRNWLRKAEDEGRYRNGQRPAERSIGRGASSSGMGPTVDAAERFLARRGIAH